MKIFLLVISFLIAPGALANDATILVPKYFVKLSKETNVPADILYALAAKETNTKMTNKAVAPWPYTLNVKGKPYSFATYQEMVDAANNFIENGTRSVDIGLFQVNWLWNGHRSESVENLGTPWENGKVAAKILLEHYRKHGDWVVAAGRYHNPANKNGRADSYAREYKKFLSLIHSGKYQKHLKKNTGMTLTKARS
ncbi:transglycosylase SLT domain-containing protein [Enterovibrio norvegicus]|uniref:transglycosylase SLT domain-containing protein n=1 Tax=Enterovibrio norvegicus TaxID=188144 RepID=UPI001304304B|nr:transglycosylase SLT domain-containing protein [Enterovibrio norvegicus]